MTQTTAASLLALVGLFDIAGTIASGWLTDRVDSRILLGGYYALRGLSLLVLPSLFAATAHPSMVIFILFYGLDWVATVPPTVALCREYFGDERRRSSSAGSSPRTSSARRSRRPRRAWSATSSATTTAAWYGAGALALAASLLSLSLLIRRNGSGRRARASAWPSRHRGHNGTGGANRYARGESMSITFSLG